MFPAPLMIVKICPREVGTVWVTTRVVWVPRSTVPPDSASWFEEAGSVPSSWTANSALALVKVVLPWAMSVPTPSTPGARSPEMLSPWTVPVPLTVPEASTLTALSVRLPVTRRVPDVTVVSPL